MLHLIAVHRQSAQGFRRAADQVDDRAISNLFGQIAEQRSRHAEELRRKVRGRRKKKKAAFRLPPASRVQRQILRLRGALDLGDRSTVLMEAERGESVIKRQYETLIEATVDRDDVHQVLSRQYAEVNRQHHELSGLRAAR